MRPSASPRPRRSAPAAAAVALVALAAGTLAFRQPIAAGAAVAPKVTRLEIVDRAIEFHGGDRYRGSTTSLTICSKSGCFDLTATVDGDRFDYDVRDPDRRVHATNDSVERFDNGERQELDAEAAQRARDFSNARVYFAFLPYRLNDPSVFKQDLGLERWGDRELHKVRVTFQEGSSTDADDAYLYWFDPQTARLEQLAYSYGSGEGAGVRFRQLSNYRRVGGILFFDQSNLGYEAPGVQVDVVTPSFAPTMREVSQVELRDIEVRELPSDQGRNR